jgi:ribonuclease HII
MISGKYIVGIDEVGRGSVTGPVCVCALVLEGNTLIDLEKKYPVKDSKKFSEKAREKFLNENILKLKEQGVLEYSVSFVTAKKIDKIGISQAIKIASKEAVKKLNLKKENTKFLLDGGLKLDENFNQETIIKGDERELVIAFASIVAKVMRDREMVNLSVKYPEYDWQNNKGYGTGKHLLAIRKHGLTVFHRKSFLRNI